MDASRPRVWPPLYVILVVILVFMASPLVIVVINSFNQSGFSQWPPTGFSMQWYRTVLAYQPFRAGFEVSVILAATAALGSLIVGSMASFALVRYRFWGRGIVRSLFFTPLTVPKVAIGFALFSVYVFSRTQIYGTLAGLILAHVILVIPFVVTIVTANLGSIDPVFEEAAQDLGAGQLRVFLQIVLPQMRTGFIVAGLFAFITSFDELETSIFLVRPQIETLPVVMYYYLEQQQTPTLAALSTLLIAGTAALVILALPMLLRGGWTRFISIGERS